MPHQNVAYELANNNEDDQQMIEIRPDVQEMRDLFKQLSHRLLRSPSGAPSQIGLDLFPEEEAEQEKIDKQVQLADGVLVDDHGANGFIGDEDHHEKDQNNSNNNNNNSHQDTLHNAYLTASHSFCPQIRCFAPEAMRHCLETGDARVSEHDGGASAFSSGQETNPWNVATHVPQAGRLLIVGPPSVGKTRFALQTTNAQPFLGRPAVYLPLDYLFSGESFEVRSISEALRAFLIEDMKYDYTRVEAVIEMICDPDRSFPIVWTFDNLEILVNRKSSALSQIEYGTSDSDAATLEKDAFLFFGRDGFQRDAFFKSFEVKNVSEWRMFNFNALEEKAFIWTACGEHHPYVSSITSTVLRAFEIHPQLAFLRGSPTTTHILTLLAMRGSNLKNVKCLSEAFELLIHLIIANQSQVKNAIMKISKEARRLVSSELTHLSFDGTKYADQGWFQSLVASGLIALIGSSLSSEDSAAAFNNDYDNNKNNNKNIHGDICCTPDSCLKVAFRNRYVAELFAHLILFQSEDDDEGEEEKAQKAKEQQQQQQQQDMAAVRLNRLRDTSKTPHSWRWLELKWNRCDRVLWTLVAGRVASRNAVGNPRELFAFHTAAQFFLSYHAYRNTYGSDLVHDPQHASLNKNKTLCYLFVEIAHILGATIVMEELLNQHGFYVRPPSHLRWMISLCGRFGAVDILKFLFDKLKTKMNPQPFTNTEMIELYIEGVLSGQRPGFYAGIAKIVDVSFDLRQAAKFGALSPTLYAIQEARRLRSATSPAFLKRVQTCLTEAESRGDTDIMNALLNALPAADSLVKQLFKVGDAALACMEARKKLWIHYAQLWHAHPTMPWESIGCFATDALEIQSFDEDGFRKAISGGGRNNSLFASNGSLNSNSSPNLNEMMSDGSQPQFSNTRLASLLAADNNTTNNNNNATTTQSSSDPNSTTNKTPSAAAAAAVTLHSSTSQLFGNDEQSSSFSFTTLKERFTRRCNPNNAHLAFTSKITLIEGAPFTGKTTFGLQLCMIQPFPDHVCVYFDLRSLILLTNDHKTRQEQQRKRLEKQQQELDKKDDTNKITSFGGFFGGGKGAKKNGDSNDTNSNQQQDSNQQQQQQNLTLPTTLDEFWQLVGLPIDIRAPVLWIFDNCGRLPKEVDNCVSNLLTEIASSSENNTNNNGDDALESSYSPDSLDQSRSGTYNNNNNGNNNNDSVFNSAPRSKDRAILLSRVLRSGARYLAKDIIHSHMQTWIMPSRTYQQEDLVINNYLQRAANLSLHLSSSDNHNHNDGGMMVFGNNDSITSSRHAGVHNLQLMLNLNPQEKRDDIKAALEKARTARRIENQMHFNKMVEAADDKNFSLLAPAFTGKGSGMMLKWICRLATMGGGSGSETQNNNNENNNNNNNLPDVSTPLVIVEQEMRRRCRAVGITNKEEQTSLIETTCIAALRACLSGFPFAVQREASKYTDEISTSDLSKMMMCDFVHAAPDLKRQEYEFRASEVDLFAALSLQFAADDKKRNTISNNNGKSSLQKRKADFLPLLQFRGEFEALWILAASSLSSKDFMSVTSSCLDAVLPSSAGSKTPPPFIPFFLLLELSDMQPSLVARALEICTNLRQAALTQKMGLASLCGLFGSLNALRDHLVATKQTAGYNSYDQCRADAVVSACSYFPQEAFVDLVFMLNDCEAGGLNNNGSIALMMMNSTNNKNTNVSSNGDLAFNESFAPSVLRSVQQLQQQQLNNNSNSNDITSDGATTNDRPSALPADEGGSNQNDAWATSPNRNNNNSQQSQQTLNSPSSRMNLLRNMVEDENTNEANTTTRTRATKRKPSDILKSLLRRDATFIKYPNSFFASATDKVFRIHLDYDPVLDTDVPYLYWYEPSDTSKKNPSKAKLHGMTSLTRKVDEKKPFLFTMELVDRGELKLEAKNAAQYNMWVDALEEYCESLKS